MSDEHELDNTYWAGTMPVPFPAKDLAKKHNFKPEPFDDLIPPDGFVTDFVLGSRNIASPTVFGIWTGMYTVSTILKRLAFYSWADTIMVPNLFMILVAPPGIVKKTTQLNKSLRLFKDVERFVLDPTMRALRMPKTRKGSITPEALHEELIPELRVIEKDNGKFMQITTGSTLNLVVSELTTLIDKKKYNLGLIDKLTSLFDSSDIGEDRTTKGDGTQELRDIYVTLAGATTPEAMRTAFPEEALGGGFMSRAIIVYAHEITRVYAMPPTLDGIPSNMELARRLAWIIDNARGEYMLSPEADKAHTAWYTKWANDFLSMPEREQNLYARYDILVLKLALLIRAQKYIKGRVIGLDDYMLAHRLLDATMGKTKNLIGHIQGSVDTDKEDEIIRRVRSKNQRDHDGLTRRNLQGYVRNIYKGIEFKYAILDLFARRMLFSYDHGDLRYDRPLERADEKYYVFPEDAAEAPDTGEALLRYVAQLTSDQGLEFSLSVGEDELDEDDLDDAVGMDGVPSPNIY